MIIFGTCGIIIGDNSKFTFSFGYRQKELPALTNEEQGVLAAIGVFHL